LKPFIPSYLEKNKRIYKNLLLESKPVPRRKSMEKPVEISMAKFKTSL